MRLIDVDRQIFCEGDRKKHLVSSVCKIFERSSSEDMKKRYIVTISSKKNVLQTKFFFKPDDTDGAVEIGMSCDIPVDFPFSEGARRLFTVIELNSQGAELLEPIPEGPPPSARLQLSTIARFDNLNNVGTESGTVCKTSASLVISGWSKAEQASAPLEFSDLFEVSLDTNDAYIPPGTSLYRSGMRLGYAISYFRDDKIISCFDEHRISNTSDLEVYRPYSGRPGFNFTTSDINCPNDDIGSENDDGIIDELIDKMAELVRETRPNQALETKFGDDNVS